MSVSDMSFMAEKVLLAASEAGRWRYYPWRRRKTSNFVIAIEIEVTSACLGSVESNHRIQKAGHQREVGLL